MVATHSPGDVPEDPGSKAGKWDQEGKEPGRLPVSQKGPLGTVWATGVKELEYLDIGHERSQALWLFSVSGQRRPAAGGQLGKAGLALGRERPPSWLQDVWTEP